MDHKRHKRLKKAVNDWKMIEHLFKNKFLVIWTFNKDHKRYEMSHKWNKWYHKRHKRLKKAVDD
jgi:hypothetical protein